jgi:cellulose synthase operon protein C
MVMWAGRRIGGAALTALALTVLAGSAFADLTPAQRALEEQGRYWEDRQRPDRAAVAWQKLLESDADNAEALLHLGIIEARAGHEGQAKTYAGRLRAVRPDAPELAVLDRAIAVGAINPNAVDEARRLAKAGQYDAAIAAYRKALNGQAPPPDLAKEYYETLAGTKTGWDEAVRALKQLADAMQGDASVQYSYARVLTYHEETRRDGIAILARISADPSVGQQATQAWHDALIWLGATRNDTPLYQAYLSAHAGDSAVAQKFESLKNPANSGQFAADAAHKRAFDELNAGRLRQAAALFDALLRENSNDVDALGGMGVVLEREGRWHDAREMLSRAVAVMKGGNSRWSDALASVIYLETVADSKAALRAHNIRLAEEKAREAMAHPFDGNVDADLVLAQIMRETKRWRDAEEIYRHVLRDKPGNREAIAGLAAVLVATGRGTEARRYAAEAPGEAADIARLEANKLADQARQQLAAGSRPAALATYQEAIARAPGNAWIRLDYARLLERTGDRGAADREIVAMISSPNATDDAFAAAAIWYGEHKEYDEATRLSERVSPRWHGADFPSLQREWRARREARHAVELAQQGRLGEAHHILEGIVAGAQGNVSVIGAAAEAYVDIGDARSAVDVMRGAAARNASVDAQMQLAGILLRAGATDELMAVLNGLDRQANSLSATQQASLADLHRGASIKLADQARTRGDYAGAYDRLAPELAVSRDATVLAALARIYDSAGRHSDAMQIYARILRTDPSNLDARHAIISAAIALGDYDRAQQLLSEGFSLAPNDPRLHLMAAELARAQGDNDGALLELSRAQAELARRNGGMWLGPDQYGEYPVVSDTGYGNPFRSPQGWQAAAAPRPVAAQGQMTYYSAYPVGATYGENTAYPVPQIAAQMSIASASTEDQQLAQQVANEIEEVRDYERPYVQGGLGFRNIDGESGLSQLSVVSAPVTGGVTIGPGKLTLRAELVDASSGELANTDPNTFRRFGTNAVLPSTATTAPSYSGSAHGVAFAVGYEMQNLAAELGTTPLGFPTSTVVGHLVWAIPLDNQTSIKLTGIRERVADSLLSFAGTRDPLSGQTWGGVAKTGGRVDVGYDDGTTGVYGDATVALLDGTHVQSNFMLDAGGGAYWRFYRTSTGALKVGVNLQAQAYERNLDYYTLGQGGYFSPQAAVEATIPIEYAGKWNKLSYAIGGQLGLMDFHESSSPYFPLDPGLQAVALGANGTAPIYPGQSVLTAIYGVSAKAEYEIAPLLVIGGRVAADNAHDYNEQSLLLYLRKKFDTD